MIAKGHFSDVSAVAYDCALSFRNEFMSEDALDLRSVGRRGLASPPILSDLILYVQEVFECDIYPLEISEQGFASWLVISGDKAEGSDRYSIALDNGPMMSWTAQTGMPLATQKIRSILHEIGHLHFSLKTHDPNTVPFIGVVQPIEEEKAWVFAMTFLGVLLGDYSFSSRDVVAGNGVDDSPSIIL